MSLKGRGHLSSFLLPPGWNIDIKSGAQAAILDHEVDLGMEAIQGGEK